MSFKVILGLKKLNKLQLMIKVIKNEIILLNSKPLLNKLLNSKPLLNDEFNFHEEIYFNNRVVSNYHYDDREAGKHYRRFQIGEENTFVILNFNDESILEIYKETLKKAISEINDEKLLDFKSNEDFEIIK